jgi:sterol 3beta-glucosyltransferase
LSRLTSKRSSKSKGKHASDAQIQEEEELASPPSSTTDAAAPAIELTRAEGRLAPVMSRMLEARAQMAARPSFDLDRLSGEQARDAESGETGPSELAKRLKDIFEFEEPEEVIEGTLPVPEQQRCC